MRAYWHKFDERSERSEPCQLDQSILGLGGGMGNGGSMWWGWMPILDGQIGGLLRIGMIWWPMTPNLTEIGTLPMSIGTWAFQYGGGGDETGACIGKLEWKGISIWKNWDERELVFGRVGMEGNEYLEELTWKGTSIWKSWDEREWVFGRIEMKGN